MKTRRAFTLIEMLVVIAIIGLVAALVVNMNGAAQVQKRNSQVNIAKRSLILTINDYKSTLNFYPPDNGMLSTNANPALYDLIAETNPLLYELTGATNTNSVPPTIICFDNTTNTQNNFSIVFSRSAVANANTDEPHNFFPSVQPKEYTNYDNVTGLKGLIVPVPGLPNSDNSPAPNFWHYDASTTNRHNPQSYDLWAEYVIGNNKNGLIIVTNGNW